MFVSDVSDFQFVGKVEPYFLSAGEEVLSSTSSFAKKKPVDFDDELKIGDV